MNGDVPKAEVGDSFDFAGGQKKDYYGDYRTADEGYHNDKPVQSAEAYSKEGQGEHAEFDQYYNYDYKTEKYDENEKENYEDWYNSYENYGHYDEAGNFIYNEDYNYSYGEGEADQYGATPLITSIVTTTKSTVTTTTASSAATSATAAASKLFSFGSQVTSSLKAPQLTPQKGQTKSEGGATSLFNKLPTQMIPKLGVKTGADASSSPSIQPNKLFSGLPSIAKPNLSATFQKPSIFSSQPKTPQQLQEEAQRKAEQERIQREKKLLEEQKALEKKLKAEQEKQLRLQQEQQKKEEKLRLEQQKREQEKQLELERQREKEQKELEKQQLEQQKLEQKELEEQQYQASFQAKWPPDGYFEDEQGYLYDALGNPISDEQHYALVEQYQQEQAILDQQYNKLEEEKYLKEQEELLKKQQEPTQQQQQQQVQPDQMLIGSGVEPKPDKLAEQLPAAAAVQPPAPQKVEQPPPAAAPKQAAPQPAKSGGFGLFGNKASKPNKGGGLFGGLSGLTSKVSDTLNTAVKEVSAAAAQTASVASQQANKTAAAGTKMGIPGLPVQLGKSAAPPAAAAPKDGTAPAVPATTDGAAPAPAPSVEVSAPTSSGSRLQLKKQESVSSEHMPLDDAEGRSLSTVPETRSLESGDQVRHCDSCLTLLDIVSNQFLHLYCTIGLYSNVSASFSHALSQFLCHANDCISMVDGCAIYTYTIHTCSWELKCVCCAVTTATGELRDSARRQNTSGSGQFRDRT